MKRNPPYNLIGQCERLAEVMGVKPATVIRFRDALLRAWLLIFSPAYRAICPEHTALQTSLAENCP